MEIAIGLPGIDFASLSRRSSNSNSNPRRDLDRALTPKQQHAVDLMRSAVKRADAEVAAVCAPPTPQTRPTVCLARNSAAMPSALTATPQHPRQPNLTALTLLCLCVFAVVVGTLTAGALVVSKWERRAAPFIDGGSIVATPATEWRDETGR